MTLTVFTVGKKVTITFKFISLLPGEMQNVQEKERERKSEKVELSVFHGAAKYNGQQTNVVTIVVRK